MRIVFHGENAASFSHGFEGLVAKSAQVIVLPDSLADRAHAQAYVEADCIVGARFSSALPRPAKLQLFHVPGAGYDAVDLGAIPDAAIVCNCFGHEQAIAEYVMAAMLAPVRAARRCRSATATGPMDLHVGLARPGPRRVAGKYDWADWVRAHRQGDRLAGEGFRDEGARGESQPGDHIRTGRPLVCDWTTSMSSGARRIFSWSRCR